MWIGVLDEIAEERKLQNEKWGAEHDDQHTPLEWVGLVADRLGLVFMDGRRNGVYFEHLNRAGLIQVAALAVAAVESIDRQAGSDKR